MPEVWLRGRVRHHRNETRSRSRLTGRRPVRSLPRVRQRIPLGRMSQPAPRPQRSAGNIAGHRASAGHRHPFLGPYIMTRAECEQVKLACRQSAAKHGVSARVRGCGRNRAAREKAGEPEPPRYIDIPRRSKAPVMTKEERMECNRISQAHYRAKDPEAYRKYARERYQSKAVARTERECACGKMFRPRRAQSMTCSQYCYNVAFRARKRAAKQGLTPPVRSAS